MTITATTLLYHRDPLLLSFDANVIAVNIDGGDKGVSVVLDETAFYPEAGGQMADRGKLGGVDVVDVQVGDDGVVRHKLQVDAGGGASLQFGPGTRVRGDVDKARRKQFMALHTAQHMLSRALIEHGNAETVSARLGESICTIDVDVTGLSDANLAKAEALVNAIVDDDVAVRSWFPDADELAGLPLRRRPKVSENIRVVAVGDDVKHAFDVSPCGGTHCVRTSQIGLVRVVGLERYKGMMRVSFQAGARARTEVFDRARVLEALAKDLSSSPHDVPAGVEKLRAQIKSARDDRGTLVDRLAALVAADLVRAASAAAAGGAANARVVATVDGDVDLMRAVGAIVAKTNDALLACASPDGTQVLLMRAPSSSFDCGAALKKIAAAAGGKGGGKPDRAEGRLPPSIDWPKLVADNAG